MKKAGIVYIVSFLLFCLCLCIVGLKAKSPEPLPTPRPEVEDDVYRMDLNSATAEQLQEIPGVGPVLAQRIVEYRDANGPYEEYADLLNVESLGPHTLRSILEYVRIN